MKQRVIILLSCAVIIAATGFLSCKKSSSPSNQANNNKTNILGNWADSVFIDASGTGPVDTLFLALYPDSLQFTASGGLNATYYTKSFNTTTDQEEWAKSVNAGTYTFVNDTTLTVSGATQYFLTFGSDTFYIRNLDANQLKLYSPNTSGTGGGYYYIYSKY